MCIIICIMCKKKTLKKCIKQIPIIPEIQLHAFIFVIVFCNIKVKFTGIFLLYVPTSGLCVLSLSKHKQVLVDILNIQND